MKFIFALFWILIFSKAFAYPTYIRLGYNSCIGCHYNPAGGGMLTPYGKGISATQSFKSTELSDVEEEKLSTQKYFQAFQGRLLNYKTETKNRFFPMQAEYLGRYEINPKYKINFNIAVAPKSDNQTSSENQKTYQRIYSRNIDLNYQLDKSQSYYLGLSPLPLGLGLVDHTNYVRANNRLQITDIPINFRAFKFSESYSYNYFLYLPHYLEKIGNSEKGLGGQYWYSLHKNLSIGSQALVGRSDNIDRKIGGFLLKTGIDKIALMSEINYTHRYLRDSNNQFGQITHYTQFTYHPKDWYEIGYAFQGLSKDRDFDSKEMRHSIMGQAKIYKYFTLMYEARLRNVNSHNETSHLLQGFVQWW